MRNPQVGVAQELAKEENMKAVSVPFPHAPRLSICGCGHTGNTEKSEHAPRFALGHGECLVFGCKCQQFTWTGWAD